MDGRPSWFFLDSVQRRNILPLMEGLRACQRHPHASMNVPSRAGTMMDEAGSSIFPADDPVSTPPIPRWCNGSTPVFGTVRRGSNPRRGATPIPLRNAQPPLLVSE